MYIPQETLHAYIAEGLLTEQRHPDADHLRIYNYTAPCQYSRAWDDVTRQCRGLILNTSRRRVSARPFPKFFNYEEHLPQGCDSRRPPHCRRKVRWEPWHPLLAQGRALDSHAGQFHVPQAQWATCGYAAPWRFSPAMGGTSFMIPR